MPSHTGDSKNQAFPPPPSHPSIRHIHSSSATYNIPRSVTHISTSPSLPEDASDLGVEDSSSTWSAPGDFETAIYPEADDGLSEAQLRESYDEEEIDRFLNLFSAYVREARVTDTSEHPIGAGPDVGTSSPSLGEDGSTSDPSDDSNHTEDTTAEDTPPPLPPRSIVNRCLSERVAMDYLVPLLPPARPSPPSFTIQRLQLAAQRLYLAIKPTYAPFAVTLVNLATWKETQASLLYCTTYWFLWYYNFLLPALVLRILYSLMRRKVLLYPTLAELRQHREEVESAKEFSLAVTTHLTSSPTYDVQDAWKIVRNLNNVRKLKKAAKRNGEKNTVDSPRPEDEDVTSADQERLDKSDEHQSNDEPDVKRVTLAALNDIADLHERVKNIFLWRRPTSSLVYGAALFAVFCLTLLPAKYLAKLLGLVIGIAFWHVVPVIAAISPAERARFPPPFTDVPTDADYAMELISQRVARGLEIKPRLRRPIVSTRSQDSDSGSINSQDGETTAMSTRSNGSSTSVDWKKWAGRMAATQSRTADAKKIFQNGQWKRPENWLALNPLSPKVTLPGGTITPRLQTYTFPAQHGKASGLITLTSDTLYFTSLLSSSARLTVPLTDVLGVKKTGPMRGLNVKWALHSQNGQSEEREEKFVWVGARNELFVRMIAYGGRRWANV